MKIEKIIAENDFESLENFAKEIISQGIKKIAFSGDLGAGKTTFIRFLIHCLGEQSFEGSPTFTIIQSYTNENQIYHMDCYRIESEQDALNLGIEELLEEDAYFFIEWPEKIKTFLPEDIIWMYIRVDLKEKHRIFQLNV